jgi:hypothetical protein
MVSVLAMPAKVRGSVVGAASAVTPHYAKRPFGTVRESPEGTFSVAKGDAPIRRIKLTLSNIERPLV